MSRAIPNSSFEREDVFLEKLSCNLEKVVATKIVLEHYQTIHKLVIQTIFLSPET